MTFSKEDMRVGRKIVFRGEPTREGDINVGKIMGTVYTLPDGYFYVPVQVQYLSNGMKDKTVMIHSVNIVGLKGKE